MAAETSVEIEQRYRVHNVDKCLDRLFAIGIAVERTDQIIDEWYIPVSILDKASHDIWFNEELGTPWRIRRAKSPKGEEFSVEGKQLLRPNDHGSIREITEEYSSYEAAHDTLESRHLRNWLTINKKRRYLISKNPTIDLSNVELVLDEIAGLAEKIGVGACLEIEYKGKGTPNEASKRIGEVENLLGFQPEDRFEKSLTVEAQLTLGHFEH